MFKTANVNAKCKSRNIVSRNRATICQMKRELPEYKDTDWSDSSDESWLQI